MQPPRITIVENGPYLVSGDVPLEVKIIRNNGVENYYEEGLPLAQAESYALCRCGRSRNMPFCDGSHVHAAFDGTETASREPYMELAESLEGPELTMMDQGVLCSYARFCHKACGDAWNLTEHSGNPKYRSAAIQAAVDCPAGRLVALDPETGKAIEPEYTPAIAIQEDPDMQCGGPIWVRGGIPLISSDGFTYEIRNRVTLCRCGQSDNKPFCDASHVPSGQNPDFDGDSQDGYSLSAE